MCMLNLGLQAISDVNLEDVCRPQDVPLHHAHDGMITGWAVKALALYHSDFCEVKFPSLCMLVL